MTALGITSLGIYCSVRARRPREAILTTTVVVIVYLFGFYIYYQAARALLPQMIVGSLRVLGYEVTPNTIIATVYSANDLLGSGNPLVIVSNFGMRGVFTPAAFSAAFRDYAIFWGLVSAICLTYAALRLRGIALKQSNGPPAIRRGARVRVRPTVGDDPIFWKEVHVQGRRRMRVLAGLIMVMTFVPPLFITLYFLMPDYPIIRDYFRPGTEPFSARLQFFHEAINVWVRVATVVFGVIALLSAATRGAGAIVGEKDRDTWVTLSTMPITPWELARGKWLGAALAPRRIYLLLVVIWSIGVLSGAVDFPMILLTAVYLATYASAFAWLGVWCSISAKSTLTSTVRTLFSSLFLLGGFWLVLMIGCGLPMSLLTAGDLNYKSVIEEGAAVMTSLTPPFMLGALPIPPEESIEEIFPFEPTETVIGPTLPLVGMLAWLALGWMIARRAVVGITWALNRHEVPVPRRRERDSSRSSTRPPA